MGSLPRAALRQLDNRTATHVGVTVDARDVTAMPLDVIEQHALAQREVAQSDLLSAEFLEQRIEQDRARDHDVGAPATVPRDRMVPDVPITRSKPVSTM